MGQGELAIYRGSTPVIEAKYDEEADQAFSEVIVESLAAVAGVEPMEVPSLYEYIDLEAVDMLLDREESAETSEVVLGFTVEEWNVFVHSDGRIRVCDGTQQIDPEPFFAPHLD